MPDFSSPDILLSLILFIVRILQPFFALLILYHIKILSTNCLLTLTRAQTVL